MPAAGAVGLAIKVFLSFHAKMWPGLTIWCQSLGTLIWTYRS
jgi:hypothetical protein